MDDRGWVNIINLLSACRRCGTIQETIEYCKFAACLSPARIAPDQYHLHRHCLVHRSHEFEVARSYRKRYRFRRTISHRDIDGCSRSITRANFGELPASPCYPEFLIRIDVRHHYLNKFSKAHYFKLLAGDNTITVCPKMVERSGGSPPLRMFRLAAREASALMACYPNFFRVPSLPSRYPAQHF